MVEISVCSNTDIHILLFCGDSEEQVHFPISRYKLLHITRLTDQMKIQKTAKENHRFHLDTGYSQTVVRIPCRFKHARSDTLLCTYIQAISDILLSICIQTISDTFLCIHIQTINDTLLCIHTQTASDTLQWFYLQIIR